MPAQSSLVVWLGIAAALSGAAQNLSKEAKVERILDLTNTQAMTDQVFDQMKAMSASQMPPGATSEQRAQAQETQRKIMELVKSTISWERIRPEMVRIYIETFSDDEIAGMLSFYQSPAGRAMIAKTPAIMKRVMELVQTRMAEILPEIQKANAPRQ